MTNRKRPRDLEANEAAVFEAVHRHMASAVDRVGPCPDPHRLLRAHAGELNEEEASPILAHAAACPLCQTLVEAIVEAASEGLDAAGVRRLDARVAAATSTRLSRGRILAFPTEWRWRTAATLAAAAALLVFLVSPGTSIDPAEWPAAWPLPATWRVPPPSVSVLRAERLDTSDMGLAAVAWRGDATGAPPAPAFDAARLAFDRADFGGAEGRLSAITGRSPAFSDAWLLLGVSRLMLGRPADAIESLERARATAAGPAQDQATWHLAVALHGAGRHEDARAVLGPMCESARPSAALACLALDELRAP